MSDLPKDSSKDSVADAAQNATNGVIAEEGMTEEERAEHEKQLEDWRTELKSTEDDISTLKQLLDSKVKRAAELKKKLGLTPLNDIKSDLRNGLQNVKESTVVQKTGEAFKTVADSLRGRFSDMKNSESFKSFQDGIGNAYGTVKERVKSSPTIDSLYNSATGHHMNETSQGDGISSAEPGKEAFHDASDK